MDSPFSVSSISVQSFVAHDYLLHQTFIITNMSHTQSSLPPPFPSIGADFLPFILFSVSLQGLCSNDGLHHVVPQKTWSSSFIIHCGSPCVRPQGNSKHKLPIVIELGVVEGDIGYMIDGLVGR